jgi:hypothetical protein
VQERGTKNFHNRGVNVSDWGEAPVSPTILLFIKPFKPLTDMQKPNLTEDEYEQMFVFMLAVIIGTVALIGYALYRIFC